MAYDSRLPDIWWGAGGPPQPAGGPAFGPQGAIPFNQRTPTAPGAPTTGTGTGTGTSIPTLPDYSQIQSIIQQINATNQQAQSSANAARIPNATALETQSSQNIAALLNPPDVYAELDVPAAARGVASGTVGSPFAGVTGLNLTRTQQMADRAAGQQQLNMAYARNPGAQIADPQQLLQFRSAQEFQAQQNALARALQERIVNAQMANEALQNRLYGRFRGGGGYGPNLPTDYNRRGTGTGTGGGGVTPNIPPLPPNPSPRPSGGAVPNIGALDNWYDLTAGQQTAYNQALSQNPYFGLPDWQNPYSGDAQPLPDLGPAPQFGGYDPYADDYFNYFT